ncbi:type II secretion system protein GspM [Pseudazoarcus pumilus]|uniref:General secretion pathway protein GspM n=1 Tax=Pseudazoarcus pumilus TaxID=2067960 RepID=A0A2I6S917_9RHOO|nr:type II secretion system protein GspM [Pseudazoarcus pumilus]AUN95753.1 hypothetical protein C0099_12905 [Pseudazoarcus pumilus]
MTRAALPAAAFSLGVSAVALLVGLLIVAGALLPRAQWAAETLDSIEPRYARLLGLRDAEARIAEADQALTERLRALAYSAATPADRAGAELQQRLRAQAAESGFSVVGSQIQPARELDGFEAVAVSAVMEGSIEHLAALAAQLGELRPAARVVALSVTPLRGRGVTASRNIRVELSLAVARLVQ